MATRPGLTAVAACATVCILAGCRSASPLDAVAVTAPNPEGCFVQVWEAPDGAGRADFINGPATLARMRDLPGQRSWSNRIRSLRIGPTARVTVWANELFRGTTLRLTEVAYMKLPDNLSGTIESMNIECTRRQARLPIPDGSSY